MTYDTGWRRDIADAEWDEAVKAYKENPMSWDRRIYGARPLHDGCRVPPHILAANGYPQVFKMHPKTEKASATGGQKAQEKQSEREKVAEPSTPDPTWPSLDTKAAHIGLAWEVVEMIGPETEADHFAILLLFLVAFGNAIDRGSFHQIEGNSHYTNLFALLVGQSSIGRKGTAQGRIDQIMAVAEHIWATTCRGNGLVSGEGLIFNVRDEVTKIDKGGDEKTVDPGVDDKRLYVVEGEFASVLAAMKRDSNTLSPVMRSAWDGAPLRTMAKNSPNRATNAMISIVGHITMDELRRELDRSSMGNGFANRFLFACVKRSKSLPHGGNIPEYKITELGGRVAAAIDKAREVKKVDLSPEAKAAWPEMYDALTVDRPGLLGVLTARGAPQVKRLAMIYALLDGSDRIELVHLKAGLAVWNYCDASVQYVFGDMLGDPMADELMRALRSAGTAGMTRTAIRDLFGRHGGEKIGLILNNLMASKKVIKVSSQTGGRPVETWYAVATKAT